MRAQQSGSRWKPKLFDWLYYVSINKKLEGSFQRGEGYAPDGMEARIVRQPLFHFSPYCVCFTPDPNGF